MLNFLLFSLIDYSGPVLRHVDVTFDQHRAGPFDILLIIIIHSKSTSCYCIYGENYMNCRTDYE